MRTFAWLSAILVLAAAPTFAQTPTAQTPTAQQPQSQPQSQGVTWKRYELEGGAVSVDLPAAPSRRETTAGEATPVIIYTAVATSDVGAVVMIADTPGGGDPATVLDRLVKRQVAPADLISRKDLTIDGSPAVNIVARHNGSVIYDLMVYRDGRLYQFLTTAGAGKTVAPHADAYHRSVKFKAR